MSAPLCLWSLSYHPVIGLWAVVDDVQCWRQPVWMCFTCRVHAVGNVELVKNDRKRRVYLVHPAVSSVVFRAPGSPSHLRRHVGCWQHCRSVFLHILVIFSRHCGVMP